MVSTTPLHRPLTYDWLGSITGVLCAVHCALTPVAFAAFPLLRRAQEIWSMLDVGFLLISLFAVWGAVRGTGLGWVRYAAPTGWLVLTAGLIGDRVGLAGSDYLMYLGGVGLVVAHVANIRYRRSCITCTSDD